MRSTLILASVLAAAATALPTQAGTSVRVTVTGDVEFNQINGAPLSNVNAGDPVSMSFLIDSDLFVNSPNFPTRGYEIDQSSFLLDFGATQIGLQNPFPGTPYFVIRNDDPAVDGFFVSSSFDFPIGVGIDQTGIFEQFKKNFSVTYTGTTLTSLDVLDAVGTYDFTGLTVFNMTIDDGPFNAMGMVFEQMTIEDCFGDPLFYCTGKVNTLGCTPFLTTDAGTPSLSGGPWNVTANDLLNNKNGLIFGGFAQGNIPFQGGTLCITPPLKRTPAQNSGGNPPPDDCSGVISLDITTQFLPSQVPTTAYFQTWARDPGDGFGVSLSNAVEVNVCP